MPAGVGERSSMSSSRASVVLAHAVGLAVIAWVLQPVFIHSWVSTPALRAETALTLRSEPDAARLAALARQRPLGPGALDAGEAVRQADRWLADAHAEGGTHPLQFDVSAEDFSQDQGIAALPFASLYAADVLVTAFTATGRQHYLATARDVILGFARFERSAWREPGLLWNDHAIAARVGVVLRFWNVYRTHPLYAASDAAEVLQHVARSATLLARPSHFTAWSNHGVMQNIALLQMAAGFPALVDAGSLRKTAYERLQLQWRHYLSAEGVVLEHSAGYHEYGVALLAQALDLLRINGIAPPPEWLEQLQRAEAFLARIRRPDGTLPSYGDTYVTAPAPVASTSAAAVEVTVWPLSGYALLVARDRSAALASHAMLTWSYFPGHAHKHADEPGLVLWAAGRAWIAPTGYAPYGSELRTPLERWAGSNAPHGAGEAPDPLRTSRLLANAAGDNWAALDAERRNPDGAGFRRQLLQVAACHWLVLDHALGSPTWPAAQTVWNFMPDLSLSRATDGYALRAPDGRAMHVRLHASAVQQASEHRGARDPVAGWVATPQGLTASPALRVLSPAAGWSAASFTLDGCGEPPALRVDAPDRWEVAAAAWTLRRDGSRLTFAQAGDASSHALAVPPDTAAQRAAVAQALADSNAAYPKYRNVDAYRLRMATWLGVLWLALVAVTCTVPRWRPTRRLAAPAAGAVLACWVGVALWLELVYFAA
jgi:hypothetical protein